jgi:hypothetical protein
MKKWATLHLVLLLILLASVSAAQQEFPRGYVGKISLAPASAIVGETVNVTGEGFEPGAKLELIWSSYQLDWRLGEAAGEYDGNYYGLQREPRELPLASITVESDGTFATNLEVPEGFGGMRDIVVREGDVNLNKAGLQVRADMQISPESGPIGTDITVTVTGLDSGHPMVWYLLSYDNRITGFVSAVRSHGTATFTIPAVGAPGPHLISLGDSPFGHPYLALDTSPWAHLEVPSRTFTVTEGEPVLPRPLAEQVLPAQAGTEPAPASAVMWADPWAAAVGTDAVIHGKGFEPGTTVHLDMSNMIGSRVTASGFSPVTEELGRVEVEDDGTFSYPFDFPDTLGGLHRLFAVAAEGQEELARTQIQVLPYAFELETTEVRFGDTLRLHLKGIGWTQTENIFAIVVDNTYIGYACGFSTNGDVQVPLQVSWEPGWHFIDIYPSFYRNNDYSAADEAPFLFRQALLNWQDHPSGFHFRYAFRVLPRTKAHGESFRAQGVTATRHPLARSARITDGSHSGQNGP